MANTDTQFFRLSASTLFGPHFSVNAEINNKVSDPSLVDTQHLLQSLFGNCVSEDQIEQVTTSTLDAAFKRNAISIQVANLERLFGVHGSHALSHNPVKSFTILNSTVPEEVKLREHDEVSWLVEMPRIQPNRQTVHADPQPFLKECPFLLNTARMLFTASNVMRWTFHSGHDVSYISNSRIVEWSDGSSTLHIGDDVYTLDDWKSNAELHLLGTESVVSKHGVSLPALMAHNIVDRHLVVNCSQAVSIQKAVAEENAANSNEVKQRRLGYATDVLPAINWEKPSKTKSAYSDFVAKQYDRRQKEIMRRLKEGNPMTLGEQLEQEEKMNSILLAVNQGSATLQDEDDNAAREAFINERQQPRRKRKFERNLALEGETVDPLDADDGDFEEMMANMRSKRDQEFSEDQLLKKPRTE